MKNKMERRKDQMGREQNPSLTRRGWLFQILPLPPKGQKKGARAPTKLVEGIPPELSKEPEASH
jgi:hypothetical protein